MVKLSLSKKARLLDRLTAEQKIVQMLFKYPGAGLTLSEIASRAKVSKMNASRILKKFKSQDFINLKTLGKGEHIWRVTANTESWIYKREKIIYNISELYRSGVIEYLNEYFHNPKSIILFGSFRYGQDTEDSDIDIAVESDEGLVETLSFKEFSEFEAAVGRKVKVHVFDKKNTETNLFRNIANGIVLSGFLEVSR